jgi:hypothetical protein
MKTTIEGERLRRLISEREFPNSPLSTELRAEAATYARRRVNEGFRATDIARELGVALASVGRWLQPRQDANGVRAALVPVQVVPDTNVRAGSFEVVTPRGLRVSGLDMDALCTLLARHG